MDDGTSLDGDRNGSRRKPGRVLRNPLCAILHPPPNRPPASSPEAAATRKARARCGDQAGVATANAALSASAKATPVSQPRSSVACFASQGSTPSPFGSAVTPLVLTSAPSASSSSLSLTNTPHVPPPPLTPSAGAVATLPIPTTTALAPSLSAHLRPVDYNDRLTPSFHPFARHNNLSHIDIIPRLPLCHNNVDAQRYWERTSTR